MAPCPTDRGFTPVLSFSITAIAFGVVFLAELPDKTALAGLMLGTRYRASYVFAGVAAAFAVHVALAIAAGSVLTLLPHRLVQAVVGILFLLGAAMLLLKKDDGDEEVKPPADQSFWKVSGAGFMLILVAEFGDLTQIMTANLAARYDDPVSVGIGAVLALWAVAGIGILGGRTLMKYVPLRLITKIAAAVMAALAAFSLYEAIAG
ncbi:TMEM165/GDT1 family protein [Streptomyces virginiae]|uniref:TMEM165/GDT1 family protein n=1 Tax=Streptomyces virginiae TaxID=1961 RepID=UPI003870842C